MKKSIIELIYDQRARLASLRVLGMAPRADKNDYTVWDRGSSLYMVWGARSSWIASKRPRRVKVPGSPSAARLTLDELHRVDQQIRSEAREYNLQANELRGILAAVQMLDEYGIQVQVDHPEVSLRGDLYLLSAYYAPPDSLPLLAVFLGVENV